MNARSITYEGPAEYAVDVATMLADAEGIELVGSQGPAAGDGDDVRLVLTVDGTEAAVDAAVARVRAALPPDASLR